MERSTRIRGSVAGEPPAVLRARPRAPGEDRYLFWRGRAVDLRRSSRLRRPFELDPEGPPEAGAVFDSCQYLGGFQLRARLRVATVRVMSAVKQPAQLELAGLRRKRDKNGQWRGGARDGAGRPPHDGKQGRPKRKSELHIARPKLRAGQSVHAVMRAHPSVGSLRTSDVYRALSEAMIVAFVRSTFHIIHFSIQRSHIHLIVEARDSEALARGMQGFGVSAARHINAAISARRGKRRAGTVFTDRYHAVVLSSPRQVRNTIAYVLNNWHHHGERRDALRLPWRIDPYSSALVFDGWKEREERGTLFRSPMQFNGPIVWRPKTWLLRVGWRRYGLIGVEEVPGRGAE